MNPTIICDRCGRTFTGSPNREGTHTSHDSTPSLAVIRIRTEAGGHGWTTGQGHSGGGDLCDRCAHLRHITGPDMILQAINRAYAISDVDDVWRRLDLHEHDTPPTDRGTFTQAYRHALDHAHTPEQVARLTWDTLHPWDGNA